MPGAEHLFLLVKIRLGELDNWTLEDLSK
ncbi:hypothetical protein Tco_0416209, partial [Tanacetum coccineum]